MMEEWSDGGMEECSIGNADCLLPTANFSPK